MMTRSCLKSLQLMELNPKNNYIIRAGALAPHFLIRMILIANIQLKTTISQIKGFSEQVLLGLMQLQNFKPLLKDEDRDLYLIRQMKIQLPVLRKNRHPLSIRSIEK